MGKERNKPLAEREDKPLRYYDREVCKYNLCGLCPNMLFTNTKSYLGE
jgi:RNA-binding protein Luc7-like 2